MTQEPHQLDDYINTINKHLPDLQAQLKRLGK